MSHAFWIIFLAVTVYCGLIFFGPGSSGTAPVEMGRAKRHRLSTRRT